MVLSCEMRSSYVLDVQAGKDLYSTKCWKLELELKTREIEMTWSVKPAPPRVSSGWIHAM